MKSFPRYIFFVLFSLIFSGGYLYGQEKAIGEEGTISYISNGNYYLRFESTKEIQVGDTIYVKKAGTNASPFSAKNFEPMFVVQSKSSTSALCLALKPNSLSLKDKVYTFSTSKKEIKNTEETKEILPDTVETTEAEKPIDVAEKDSLTEKEYDRKEKISGRIVVSNDAIFSSQNSSQSRLGGRLSFGVAHISNSRFSFQSYIAYQQFFRSRNLKNAPSNFIGIYQLSLQYETDRHLIWTLGRAINNKLSSIGAIDGLQVEKQTKNFYFGAASGFRPNLQNFLFDSKLFQSGAYIGYKKSAELYQLQTTLGFMDQRNQWKTDRRYLALQHTITLRSNFMIFSSAEMDIFQRRSNGEELNQLNFTSLYVSMNYRFNRKLSAFVAYDNRRNIIFYQSYFDILDDLMENQFSRQVLRARMNYKISKSFSVSAAANVRLDQNQSFYNNYQASINWHSVPKIGGTLSYRFNFNDAKYMRNTIHAIRYQKSLTKWDGSFGIYYRLLKYNYAQLSTRNPFQHFAGMELTKNFKKNMSIAGNVEFYNQKFHNTYRFNVRLTKTLK